ncbi:MAG TPA: type II secretion system protein [Candidatus Paceibacterota bacterium]|jgi:prepilin-type N-terminal cleavage/methylation domain-containing protein|nr:type II secretion system protein [Candidatus Paceibacterota bacterium]HQC46185.1 type II secretion system protein [Candidatus Paceibacterota bacterium]HQO70709.1 type II secretion system protein [Candidatus Paceibacterota bacterium]HQQ22158.1 type II secretion system protein [Candidatus Paceibacterota bacterium]
MTKKHKNKEKGFTLIELMVATSIFSMVMLASLGALFTLLGASKNSRATHTAMDNVNFALESMTRSIRMGSKYYCVLGGQGLPESLTQGKNCIVTPGTAISFLPQGADPKPVSYKLASNNNGKTIERCKEQDCVQVISDAVDVKELSFYVAGAGAGDEAEQPRVFIKLKGEVKVKEEIIPFFIQTFISQRNY